MGSVYQTLFRKWMNWAAPRGAMNADAKTLDVYHDDPGVTDDDKLGCVLVSAFRRVWRSMTAGELQL